MKTISVTCKSDQDAIELLDRLQKESKFQDHVEILMIDEAISDDDLEDFDQTLEAFYDQPWEEAAYLKIQQDMKERFDITFVTPFTILSYPHPSCLPSPDVLPSSERCQMLVDA